MASLTRMELLESSNACTERNPAGSTTTAFRPTKFIIRQVRLCVHYCSSIIVRENKKIDQPEQLSRMPTTANTL